MNALWNLLSLASNLTCAVVAFGVLTGKLEIRRTHPDYKRSRRETLSAMTAEAARDDAYRRINGFITTRPADEGNHP